MRLQLLTPVLADHVKDRKIHLGIINDNVSRVRTLHITRLGGPYLVDTLVSCSRVQHGQDHAHRGTTRLITDDSMKMQGLALVGPGLTPSPSPKSKDRGWVVFGRHGIGDTVPHQRLGRRIGAFLTTPDSSLASPQSPTSLGNVH